jgi:hypothetical protein
MRKTGVTESKTPQIKPSGQRQEENCRFKFKFMKTTFSINTLTTNNECTVLHCNNIKCMTVKKWENVLHLYF